MKLGVVDTFFAGLGPVIRTTVYPTNVKIIFENMCKLETSRRFVLSIERAIFAIMVFVSCGLLKNAIFSDTQLNPHKSSD